VSAAPAISSGDTAWVLTAAALVMLMLPGLALFYGGLVRSKSMLNTFMMSACSGS
jgi:Amt family ammonium transporter